MSLIAWMVAPYRRFAAFTGRSRRREFWAFALFYWLVTGALVLGFGRPTTFVWPFGYAVTVWVPQGSSGVWLGGLFHLVSFVPAFAVTVRRLHDVDRSGWWLLAWGVPMIGWAVVMVFLCLDGSCGRNRYGFDPRGRMRVEMYR